MCRQLGVKAKLLPRDVRTQWNSTFFMLEAAIAYRLVYDALTAHKDNSLRMYELSDEEWELAEQLSEVLQVRFSSISSFYFVVSVSETLLKIFKEATEFFSRKNESLLSSVIPVMDDIDETLQTSIDDKKYSTALLHALTLGRRTLNKYYSHTDASELYRTALSESAGFLTTFFYISSCLQYLTHATRLCIYETPIGLRPG